MIKVFSSFFISCIPGLLFALSLSGSIKDDEGNPLPFANVYLQGTSIGTTTNMEGLYNLEVEAGLYSVAYQYMGYETKVLEVDLRTESQVQHVQLIVLSNQLKEVVVRADDNLLERIIRSTIKKRSKYLNQTTAYRCKSYVKGQQKIENLPKKIMGQSLEELHKTLDSTGSGIIYLSESFSTINYKKGKFKEKMQASKLSGNDNGFSFNSGVGMMESSFYENTVELGDSKLLSPIGNGAMAFYNYKLEGIYWDENNRQIYKIKVMPKNKLGPFFTGTIYIVDGEWALSGANLWVTGAAANVSVLDTVRFKQTYLPFQDSIWRLFSQEINFNLKIMFIRTSGTFVGVFSEYDLNPVFEPGFFDAEVFAVEDSANQKLWAFWDSIRPVPLTKEERVDYKEKDSLQEIWSSKPYMDSVDRKRNEFGVMNILTGYTWQNSWRKEMLTFVSPLQSLFLYNTVQGYTMGLDVFYRKELKKKGRYYRLNISGDLGFSELKPRATAYWVYKFNNKNDRLLKLEGGRKLTQFNGAKPIGSLTNTISSLFRKRNYMKLYNKDFMAASFQQRIANGLFLVARTSYAQRSAVENTSARSVFFKTNRYFFSNNPLDVGQAPAASFNEISFRKQEHFQFSVALRIRLKQTYISYPEERFYTPSRWPDIWLKYKKGLPLLGGDTDYDILGFQVKKNKLSVGILGLFSYNFEANYVLRKQAMAFIDYLHFNGNQSFGARTGGYLNSFQRMDYYAFSTDSYNLQLHLEHSFNGLLWSKLPGLKKLGFEFVIGAKAAWQPEMLRPYTEFSLGIDRIGWKLFRLWRIDGVLGIGQDKKARFGVVVGFDFNL